MTSASTPYTNSASTNSPTAGRPPVGKVSSYAFWGHDGRVLADFYAAALGWKVTKEFPDEHGVPVAFIVNDPDWTTTYVFYTAKNFTPPNWPADELPFHLDLAFDDIEAAVRRLLELGATKPEHQPGGEQWTVLLDPSGQPFCVSRPWTA
ncbi:VOC family protein [Streptomyces halobius]|uniref:VOC family protein n=1 Tax=Streptomyces halobius TaxID=2879846 RepID=A0ABY4M8C8_9ACTN|nr:VOC family protein [Streptomyces halobius]UQA93617.1 VOC family protein [Streptomyces halobius]